MEHPVDFRWLRPRKKENEENKLALLPLFSDGTPKYDPAAKYLGSEVYVVHSNNGGRTLR